MSKSSEHLLHARTLRADVLAAPDTWIPRRDAVVEWLNAFVVRATAPAYILGETEAADLKALEQFLRGQHVAVSA